MSDQPLVVILGAGRSGTTLLAEHLLAHHPDVAYWTEPNHVWNYGNLYASSDVREADEADPQTVGYIREQFRRYADEHAGSVLIEKTPANCLRVPFIAEVFPEAKIVHLIRDGRDVALSAAREWRGGAKGASSEQSLAAKIAEVGRFLYRQIVIRDLASSIRPHQLPYYAYRALEIVRTNLAGGERTWGPKIPDLERIRREHTLLETCAIQWRECVRRALYGVEAHYPNRSIEVRYEDLLAEPAAELDRIRSFAGLSESSALDERAAVVDDSNAGKWRERLSDDEYEDVMAQIGHLLEELGYPKPSRMAS